MMPLHENFAPISQARQMTFAGMATKITIAEVVFWEISEAWSRAISQTSSDRALPREADELALACVLLSVEWGNLFTGAVQSRIGTNRAAMEPRGWRAWMDRLPWELCTAANMPEPPRDSSAVKLLTENLDHPNSSIRAWMFELAWFAFPWLDPSQALPRLLKNVADTLGGVEEAAGLASRFFNKPKDFFEAARAFVPPAGFEEQYTDRLNQIEDRGTLTFQAIFQQTETRLRKRIESVCFAWPGASPPRRRS